MCLVVIILDSMGLGILWFIFMILEFIVMYVLLFIILFFINCFNFLWLVGNKERKKIRLNWLLSL